MQKGLEKKADQSGILVGDHQVFNLEAYALELVEPIMRANARRIFRLDEKEKALSNPPWA